MGTNVDLMTDSAVVDAVVKPSPKANYEASVAVTEPLESSASMALAQSQFVPWTTARRTKNLQCMVHESVLAFLQKEAKSRGVSFTAIVNLAIVTMFPGLAEYVGPGVSHSVKRVIQQPGKREPGISITELRNSMVQEMRDMEARLLAALKSATVENAQNVNGNLAEGCTGSRIARATEGEDFSGRDDGE